MSKRHKVHVQDRTAKAHTRTHTFTDYGIIMVVFFALVSGIKLSGNIFDKHVPIGQDYISSNERRFSGLKEELAGLRPHGTVGYISHMKAADIRFAGNLTADYYLTQYALAPIVIDYSMRHPFVVGNFTSPPRSTRTSEEESLVMVRDYGNGVFLFRRAEESLSQ